MRDQIQIVGQTSPQDITSNNETLIQIKSVFPFDFFPDEVVLDRFKINIIKREFFFTERSVTIPLSGGTNIRVNKGPFMSQIEINDRLSEIESVKVRFLKNDDAVRFREVVEGMVIGINQGINFMSMSKDELIRSTLSWGAVTEAT
ncbi:MAG: hypothetical protein M3Q81_02940 [bacterium]|nr:hypothetical protein [bacterium]